MADQRDLEARAAALEVNGLREEIRTGFVEIRGRLDATAAGQQPITDRLTTLIAREGDEPDTA